MLGQRRRRWANIKTLLFQRMFSGTKGNTYAMGLVKNRRPPSQSVNSWIRHCYVQGTTVSQYDKCGGGYLFCYPLLEPFFNRDSLLLGLVISYDLLSGQSPVICDSIPKYTCEVGSDNCDFMNYSL